MEKCDDMDLCSAPLGSCFHRRLVIPLQHFRIPAFSDFIQNCASLCREPVGDVVIFKDIVIKNQAAVHIKDCFLYPVSVKVLFSKTTLSQG